MKNQLPSEIKPIPAVGEYNALLDAHETDCTLGCGCRLFRLEHEPNATAIKFCVTHEAVPKLAKELESAIPARKAFDALNLRVAELTHVLFMALPYVEEAQRDDAYKPGAVAKMVAEIRAVIGQ